MRQTSEGVIDHVEIPVSQFEPARSFYREALRQLGLEGIIIVKAATGDRCRAGFGKDGCPQIWRFGLIAEQAWMVSMQSRYRMADATTARLGIRGRYHDSYYAGYIPDPDGNNIEAVCQEP